MSFIELKLNYRTKIALKKRLEKTPKRLILLGCGDRI